LDDEAVAFMRVICQALQIDSKYVVEYENAKEWKIGHLRPFLKQYLMDPKIELLVNIFLVLHLINHNECKRNSTQELHRIITEKDHIIENKHGRRYSPQKKLDMARN
jgi:hypothetical protein